MKEETKKDLLKAISATVFTVALASAVFLIVNGVAFAAAAQPISLDYVFTQADTADFNKQGYKEPELNIIWDKNLDEDGNPYPYNIPKPDAMPYEEAARIGAKYIWDMTGDSIDGKCVEMMYAAWPSNSRAYWIGKVADSLEDFEYSGAVSETRHGFMIDAVTGERIGIDPDVDILPLNEIDLGEGRTLTMTPVELEASQYQEPPEAEPFKEIAKDFARKHFNHSKVISAQFAMVTLSMDRAEYMEACDIGRDIPYSFTLYGRGRQIYFDVSDDTGRCAIVMIDMDSRQVMSLDTSESDFIPGYNADDGTGLG